ncbi:serine/threonine protein kinase [Halomonas cupida]|uniref:serine/threonine protein kinase n=1 Tax=Halomonas cupida TaxID=44933 RepID=UPI003A9303D9
MTTPLPPFAELSPTLVVSAIESLGFWLPGEPFALNSYENRVYMVHDEERKRWVVKFYRPGRWTDAQIQEEHDWLFELANAGVPVGAPWRNDDGESLHHVEGFRLALFPQLSGQAPELENPSHLFVLGELIGQMHAVGERSAFTQRLSLAPVNMARQAGEVVLSGNWMDRRQRQAYERISAAMLRQLDAIDWKSVAWLRVHGDCHIGNMLGRDEHFALVDFDDALMAPAVQDLWMLLTAEDAEERFMQYSEVVEGYEQAREFDRSELALMEPLRALRLVRHSAWIVSRWEDPAFPAAFPWISGAEFWDSHIRQLEHQRLAMDQAPRWLA